MWTCLKCNRNFKMTNQSHYCTTKDIGELFLGKPDELVLAFDQILQVTSQWEPNSVGASVHTIVFTSQKAWLIIKPMKSVLDVKFYYPEVIQSDRFHKVSFFSGKYAHHLRIQEVEQLDSEFFELLRIGYDYSLE